MHTMSRDEPIDRIGLDRLPISFRSQPIISDRIGSDVPKIADFFPIISDRKIGNFPIRYLFRSDMDHFFLLFQNF